ncbi:alpha-N-acetylgalactosamine-specific lectin-like [Rhinoraja longicauda]
MMLDWVLVLTALLASDVAGLTDSLGPEENQHHIEKRKIIKGPCAEKWFYFASSMSCYRYFPIEKTWYDAEVLCNAQNRYGNLVTVNSKEHNAFIAKVILAVSKVGTSAWIGLSDNCKEGTFTWIDGSPLKHPQWGTAQPDNLKGLEDCVLTNYFRKSDGTWNDTECGNGHGFVCSYNLLVN